MSFLDFRHSGSFGGPRRVILVPMSQLGQGFIPLLCKYCHNTVAVLQLCHASELRPESAEVTNDVEARRHESSCPRVRAYEAQKERDLSLQRQKQEQAQRAEREAAEARRRAAIARQEADAAKKHEDELRAGIESVRRGDW